MFHAMHMRFALFSILLTVPSSREIGAWDIFCPLPENKNHRTEYFNIIGSRKTVSLSSSPRHFRLVKYLPRYENDWHRRRTTAHKIIAREIYQMISTFSTLEKTFYQRFYQTHPSEINLRSIPSQWHSQSLTMWFSFLLVSVPTEACKHLFSGELGSIQNYFTSSPLKAFQTFFISFTHLWKTAPQ